MRQEDASYPRPTHKRRVGDAAEASAARFLESRQLAVIDRAYLRRVGELDLICVDPDTRGIVFVEVRFRASQDYGGPLASVTAAKATRLRRTASAWLQRHADPRRAARIDVIGIALTAACTRLPPGLLDPSITDVPWEGQYLTWVQSAC